MSLPLGTVWLLQDIAESKGRQALFERQSPQVLRALRDAAIVQSVESSNRIEGVTIDPRRLRPVVLALDRPRDRSEEELQGYRRALDRIHTAARDLPIEPATCASLHAVLLAGAGDAGEGKRTDNEIVELRSGLPPRVRFRPVGADNAPAALQRLCLEYREAIREQSAPALVAIAALVLDFLCIHPFRDGNGRISRLLTLLTLYQEGFEVGRFVSLERLVEEEREAYYAALERSSQGWHEGRHDLLPWLDFFLSILRRAYRELEGQLDRGGSPRGAKRALVVAAIEAFPGRFTLAELERASPGVSRDMVRRVLRDLAADRRVRCLGRGPGAEWVKEGKVS